MIQPYDYFIPLLLRIVSEHKSIALADAIAIIKTQESYSEEDLRQMTSSGYPLLNHRIGWAKTYLKKAGLISQAANRSPIQITKSGSLLAKQNLQVIDKKYLRNNYPVFDAWIDQSNKKSLDKVNNGGNITLKNGSEHEHIIQTDNRLTPEEALIETYKTLKYATCNDLLEQLRLMNPYRFEKVILDLLVKMGYGKAVGTPYCQT